MRPKFEILMKEIHQELVEMGALIEKALAKAKEAFLSGAEKKVQKIHEYEYKIDRKQREIEQLCMHVLLTQQPVAGDLRLISAALRMIADMERIGDQAEDLAEIALHIDRTQAFETDILTAMYDTAFLMVKDSINAFVHGDTELAQSVIVMDDIVDGRFIEMRSYLIDRIRTRPDTAEQALDLLMSVKYLERIGDHACNIGEWVIYSVTGEHHNGVKDED